MWLIEEIRIWWNNRRAIKKLVSGEWVNGYWERGMMDFETWWEKQGIWPSEYTAAACAWQAAQEAERERIKELLALLKGVQALYHDGSINGHDLYRESDLAITGYEKKNDL